MAEDSEAKGDAGEETPRRRVNIVVAGAIAGLVLIVAAGIFFSFKFVESEQARTRLEWQVRLGIVADSRVAEINDWVEANFDVMRELTENASLQLYMSQVEQARNDNSRVADATAEIGFLRNLLVATADRNGFAPPPAVQETNSNVERVGVAGMALTDANGVALVVTPEMPPVAGRLRSVSAKALEGEPAFVDMYRGATNLPTMGFALPVFGVQEDAGGSRSIGVAFGVKVIDEELFDLLIQPGDISKTAETYLVRKTPTVVEYLSPLRDGTRPLRRSIALDTPDLAAAFALEKPGGFAIKRDYAGDEVLVTSRAVAGLPWVLVRKISKTEALAASDSRLRTILIVFVLIIIGVTVGMVAVWRHGTSLRAAAAAEKFRIAAERFENISKFMRVVTNSQPTAIIAVDGSTAYTFANQPAAAEAGIEPEDMLGKTMASVMGPVKAKYFADLNTRLLEEFVQAEKDGMEDSVQRTRQSHIKHFENEDGELEVIKSDHIPLRGDRDHPPGILMILDDITEFTREHLRSEARLHQLVSTLVHVVDRRDPSSANKSNHVGEVAKAIAGELDLEKIETDTAEIAGNLLTLGNIYIPIEVLSKPEDQLSTEELASIENSYKVSAELLDGVDFSGPVVETIGQSGETWDGGGPLGIGGGDILLTARIVSVARSFIDMVSPTGGGEGASFEVATNMLLQRSGVRYDRKVVAALLNHLENHGGGEKWSKFRELA